MNTKALLSWLGAALLLAPVPALAGATPWQEGAHSRARLITGAISGSSRIEFGIQIELQPGWETYWRSPGDAGAPPVFDWSGSENAGAVQVRWPLPARIERYGMVTWGYLQEVVFPATAEVADPASRSRVRLQLTYAACANVCILNDAEFTLDLGAESRGDEVVLGGLVASYAARVPEQSPAWLAVSEFRVVEGGSWTVEFTVESDRLFEQPGAIVEGLGLAFAASLIRIEDAGGRAVFGSATVVAPHGTAADGPFTLTLFERGLSAETPLRSASPR